MVPKSLLLFTSIALSGLVEASVDADKPLVTEIEAISLSCTTTAFEALSIENGKVSLIDEDMIWTPDQVDHIVGNFEFAKREGHQIVVMGAFEMLNFDLVYEVSVNLENQIINVHLLETDANESFLHEFNCQTLIIDDEVFAYPEQAQSIVVDNNLHDEILKDLVYNASLKEGYDEIDGVERSINKSDMSFNITEIVKAPNGHGLIGMKVSARGTSYSDLDELMLDWYCENQLFKARGEWWVATTTCHLDLHGH